MAKLPKISIEQLIAAAKNFCEAESLHKNTALFGVTDGKAVDTLIEQKFKNYLSERFEVQIGNSASGIDLPSEDILTDIKVTSVKQPQSSCPFKDAKQKIFGLGYNLLVFVYDKTDNAQTQTAVLNFVSCAFIKKERTADYQTTLALRQMLENQATEEEIVAFLRDRNLPADEITLAQIAQQILEKPPLQGYLTISNALQWRLQYGRVVGLVNEIDGIVRIVSTSKFSFHAGF